MTGMADRFVSIILDVFSGEKRMLPKPIAGLTNDGASGGYLSTTRACDSAGAPSDTPA